MSIMNNSYWNGIPKELRVLCDFEYSFNDVRHKCVTPALVFIRSHADDCSDGSSVTSKDYLRWIEAGFDHCLFPLEIHSEDWAKNAPLINEILNKATELLIMERPNVFNESIIKPEANLPCSDLYEISQKITLYYCVYYSVLERWDEMKGSLNLLLAATERNVVYLLNRRDKVNFRCHNDELKYYFLTDEAYEPLFWLYYHDLPNLRSKEYLAETYEEYALFIDNLSDELPDYSQIACKGVQLEVEKHLAHLCDGIIMNALDAIACKYGPEEYWNNTISYFESIKIRSEERCLK